MNYKKQKALLYLVTGLVPFFSFSILNLLKFPMIGLYGIPILITLILVFASHKLTSMNNWIKAIQGDCVLVLDVNSTGVGKAYDAKVVTNFFGGIDLQISTGNNTSESLAYDRSMAHRIGSPLKGVINFFKGKQNKVEADEEKPKVTITLDNDEYEKAAWHYEYITVFFYNSQTGMLLNKPAMSDTEKEMMSEYVTLNEWRETKNLCKQMESLTNHMFNLLGQKMNGVLSNPVVQIFMVIVVIIIILLVIAMFVPGAMEAIFPASKAVATTAPPMQPILGGKP